MKLLHLFCFRARCPRVLRNSNMLCIRAARGNFIVLKPMKINPPGNYRITPTWRNRQHSLSPGSRKFRSNLIASRTTRSPFNIHHQLFSSNAKEFSFSLARQEHEVWLRNVKVLQSLDQISTIRKFSTLDIDLLSIRRFFRIYVTFSRLPNYLVSSGDRTRINISSVIDESSFANSVASPPRSIIESK